MNRPFAPMLLALLVLCLSALGHSANAVAGTRRALLIGIGAYGPPPGKAVPQETGHHSPDSRFAPGTSWVSLNGPLVDVAAMQFLLTNQFGFQTHDVRVLDQHEATRRGILAALDQLIAATQPGDFVVVYYAGHGSRRLDTLSSKNQFDQTIVPIDAWRGAEDIRDKELAVLFDQLVYDRHAHLTAIFDSCDSGTMARGITESTPRALPYDDRDVAEQKRRDPRTVVESDLKRIPQDGDAIIVAAAAPGESAVEARYRDDMQYHGAFTRALVRVLASGTQTFAAADVVAQVAAVMHADPVPFQQPSVEGRVEQSLFGSPVAPHPLVAHVVAVSADTVTLDLGSVATFDTGTQFTAVDAAADGTRTRLEVKTIDAPVRSTASIAAGPTDVQVGQAFELSRIVYAQSARLQLFIPPPEADAAAAVASASQAFPHLVWVADPTEQPVAAIVYRTEKGWIALDQQGHPAGDPASLRGAGFLLLGPSASIQQAIRHSVPFESGAFTLTDAPGAADYVMATRVRTDGTAQTSLLDPAAMSNQARASWIRGPESDPDETALNGGVAPEVVCRNEHSRPVRTAWLTEPTGRESELAFALIRRIVRLGKLRTWLKTPELSPGLPGWPYQLQLTSGTNDVPLAGPLSLHQHYQVRLVTTADARAANNPIPRYVYVMGFDCAANPFLLYPKTNLDGDGTVPQPGAGGVYPLTVSLGVEESVGRPLGADTLFLLVTQDKLSRVDWLVADGVLEHDVRGTRNQFDELISHMNDASVRGPEEVPSTWAVQQLVVPSR